MKIPFFLLFFVSNISLACELSPYSETNPYSDPVHARLLKTAEVCQVPDSTIEFYKNFLVHPDHIVMIVKVATEIKGQEPYKAQLRDGNIIEATYHHSGPSAGYASVFATYHKPGIANPLYLPINLKNFSIIKYQYQKMNHD